jgi:hypothetical protein
MHVKDVWEHLCRQDYQYQVSTQEMISAKYQGALDSRFHGIHVMIEAMPNYDR